MTDFARRYSKLNPSQRQAVDAIEGPVMVVAGPGTGKTELLSLRVANILQKTDTLAENILCLTFTESGADAMRQRLTGLLGQDAYKVTVSTFHSFGSEIINANPDYFYNGASFRPADELSSYEVLEDIFQKLPHDNPLNSKLNDEFTQLRNVQNTINDLKNSGLTPDELQRLLIHNEEFIEYAEPLLQPVFEDKIGKQTAGKLTTALKGLQRFKPEQITIPNLAPLSTICIEQLAHALDQAEGTTKPITAWRNQWLEKDGKGKFVLKARKQAEKLRAASIIYADYLANMTDRALYDYNDMILRVVHALEVFDELRFNLQERYQYIMVDEFQDTNGAQMRILSNLTRDTLDNQPNLMVVGDDDQAIFSFQGAEVGNILSLREQFPKLKTVTLKENYRSTNKILDAAREVITQGEDRLENKLASLNKKLNANHKKPDSKVELYELESRHDEYSWIASQVARQLKAGEKPEEIAIIARSHSDLRELLPYLASVKVPVYYQHKNNVLEQEPVATLVKLGRTMQYLASGAVDQLNSELPELLSHEAWQLEPKELWNISLEAHQQHKKWLEVMLASKNKKVSQLANWLVETAYNIIDEPLDHALDILFGSVENNENTTFESPLKEYFFAKNKLETEAASYLQHLRSIRYLRHKLAEYRPDTTLKLKDFINYIDLHQQAKLPLALEGEALAGEGLVHVMTAHKAKGLEFNNVFIVNATENTWGSKSRKRPSRLSYPQNLPLAPAGDTYDERLRLFFVAMTRARNNLFISYGKNDFSGKPMLRTEFLVNAKLPEIKSVKQHEEVLPATGQISSFSVTNSSLDLKALLAKPLARYKLSASHLNHFIDITENGPENFFFKDLLHFPQAISDQAAFGSAIHQTLQRAHAQLSSTGNKRPLEDVLHSFEQELSKQPLSSHSYQHLLQKGSDILPLFIEQYYDEFTADQIAERDFYGQDVVLGKSRLTGVIDVMSVDLKNKTVTVIDYKTGKPSLEWKGKADYEKVKLHKYKQQLMFYKLLIENSRQWSSYKVEQGILQFVEPENDSKKIPQLELKFNDSEIADFKKLVAAIWQHIQSLNFPEINKYPKTYKGILEFEKDLINSLD